jgi:hypothetical protein
MSPLEFAIYTTIRIQTDNSVGTGFYFYFEIESEQIACIVTNKHVLEDTKNLYLFSQNNNPLYIPNYNMPHPDPDVDLAIIPLASHMSGINPKAHFLTVNDIPLDNKNILPIEDIIMIGYPIGLWDEYNNLPVVRKGITATPYLVDYRSKKEFLIDMACFPGSSGSPIFLINEGAFSTSDSFIVGSRFHFLGILYAGPTFNATGTIEQIAIPCHTTENYINTPIMMNLGYCIKSEKLNDFIPLIRKQLLIEKVRSR